VVVSFKANDGTVDSNVQTLTITVTGTNDAPVAQARLDAATEGGATINGHVVATDLDDGQTATLVYSLTSGPAPAGLTFNADGSYSFDPANGAYDHLAAGAHQDVVVSFKANDGTVDSNVQTLTITVTGTNDAPVITSASIASEAENSPTTHVVYTASASDVDSGDAFTFSLAGDDAGRFDIDASSGAVTFKASPNYEVPADITNDNVYDIAVIATDSHGLASAAQAVAITVTNVSETPTTTISGIDISVDSGNASDFITNVAAQTITATLSAGLVTGEFLLGSVDGGTSWTDISSKVSGTAVSWNGATLAGSSSIQFKVANAGDSGPVASQSYVLDTTSPDAPVITGFANDTGAAGDHITGDKNLVISGTAEANAVVTVFDGANT
jgi:VCBS repeat-containing protein